MRQIARITRRGFGQGAAVLLFLAGHAGHSSTRAGEVKTVTIRRFRFSPRTLRIKAGTSVQWTNQDAAPHTATSEEGRWDTGDLKHGQSALITFTTPGTHTYICTHHPAMKAMVIVEG